MWFMANWKWLQATGVFFLFFFFPRGHYCSEWNDCPGEWCNSWHSTTSKSAFASKVRFDWSLFEMSFCLFFDKCQGQGNLARHVAAPPPFAWKHSTAMAAKPPPPPPPCDAVTKSVWCHRTGRPSVSRNTWLLQIEQTQVFPGASDNADFEKERKKKKKKKTFPKSNWNQFVSSKGEK